MPLFVRDSLKLFVLLGTLTNIILDCGIGMVCWQRDRGDSGKVPSCSGNANAFGTGADDYCVIRPSSTYLSTVYDHHSDAEGGVFPIGLCSGDCDFGKKKKKSVQIDLSSVLFLNSLAWIPADSDCQGNLVCYSRSGLDPVPGCLGKGEENFDYCVQPSTPKKALDYIGDEDNGYYTLKECQGGKILQACERL